MKVLKQGLHVYGLTLKMEFCQDLEMFELSIPRLIWMIMTCDFQSRVNFQHSIYLFV